MINKIPCDYFGHNMTIYFDLKRLSELEALCGTSVTDMALGTGGRGVSFVLNGCIVGLRHHFGKLTTNDVATLIEGFLDKGGTLSRLEVIIGRAILASGVFGKEAAERAINFTEDAIAEAPEEAKADVLQGEQ